MVQGHEVNVGEIVLHHTADSYSFGLEGLFHNRFVLHWEKWPDIHLGPLTFNLTPTKHVVFMVIAAVPAVSVTFPFVRGGVGRLLQP